MNQEPKEIEIIEAKPYRNETNWVLPEGEPSAIVRWVLERLMIGYGVPVFLMKVASVFPSASLLCSVLGLMIFIVLVIAHWKAFQEEWAWSIFSGFCLLLAIGLLIFRLM